MTWLKWVIGISSMYIITNGQKLPYKDDIDVNSKRNNNKKLWWCYINTKIVSDKKTKYKA